MKRVNLDELLTLEGLTAKQYTVIETGHDSGGDCLEIEIQAKGCIGNDLYVASQRVRQDIQEKDWKLDEAWRPYIEVRVGNQTLQSYDPLFLGNTSFATGMQKSHQNYLLQVFEKVKQEQHPLYQKFHKDITKIIAEAPHIKEAHDRKYYFNDTSMIQAYSKRDLLIFEYLCTKKVRYKLGSSEYDPDNYITHDINLATQQHVDCVGKTKEEAAFLVWYRHYLKQNSYERKIEPRTFMQKVRKAFRAHVETLAQPLVQKGFEKVQKLSYE